MMQFYIFIYLQLYIELFILNINGLNVPIKISAEWIKINACYKRYIFNIRTQKGEKKSKRKDMYENTNQRNLV